MRNPGSLIPLLAPSEPACASLLGSLSTGMRKEHQMTDLELFIAGERGHFGVDKILFPENREILFVERTDA
jgi:hypothetical protein